MIRFYAPVVLTSKRQFQVWRCFIIWFRAGFTPIPGCYDYNVTLEKLYWYGNKWHAQYRLATRSNDKANFTNIDFNTKVMYPEELEL